MNKYQESLNHISELAAWTRSDSDVSPHKDLLQELVDKETPMKPIHMGGRIYSCDRCAMAFEIPKIRFVGNQYCDVCGQKIDWTNE